MSRRKKSMVFLLIFGIFSMVISSALFFPLFESELPQEAEEVNGEQTSGESEAKAPNVSFSSVVLEQSETLVLVSDQEPVTGWFMGEPFPFFSFRGEWVALVGISAKLSPGSYDLEVVFPREKVRRRIEVRKRAFPVTELVVTQELEEQGYTPATIAENIALRENAALQDAMEVIGEMPYFQGPFRNPLASMKVVGAYGNIRKSGDIELQHLGLDLEAVSGTAVYAANTGVVSFAEPLTNYGNTLVLNHGLGLYSLYLHLSRFDVQEGDMVESGQIIGASGNTGYSIAPHLHFSMKMRGASIHPSRFCEIVNQEVFGVAGCLQAQ